MHKLVQVTKTLPNGATVQYMAYEPRPAQPTKHHEPGAIAVWLRPGLENTPACAVKVVEKRGTWLHVVEHDGMPHRVKPHNVVTASEARSIVCGQWQAAQEADEWLVSER